MSGKRDSIIAAALKLFCENGFQNTSTANISKEAGVATGTLFLYFKSKDELINALYKEAKTELAAYFQQDLEAETTIENKLQHFWQKAIDWALDNPYHFRFFNMYSNSPFISNLTKEEAASTFQFTQDLVEEAIKAGSIEPINCNLFINLFSGQLNATVGFLTQNLNLENRQEIIDQAFAIFWKGISKG
ncbi:TetR/AcrR family transcriptional regulator [Adhaeribacter terreus]|uniref:TetR/AcrR family transcriptional regulator n=1 Tax=Adhaeribacter terreus TaxID=529703 RepID=A0ABW0E494_9BACT